MEKSSPIIKIKHVQFSLTEVVELCRRRILKKEEVNKALNDAHVEIMSVLEKDSIPSRIYESELSCRVLMAGLAYISWPRRNAVRFGIPAARHGGTRRMNSRLEKHKIGLRRLKN